MEGEKFYIKFDKSKYHDITDIDVRRELKRKYKAGEITPSQYAEEYLCGLENYIYYIFHHQFSPYKRHLEDLAQQARIAIVEKLDAYNPEYTPTTYFKFHIINAMQDYILDITGQTHYYRQELLRILKVADSLGFDSEDLEKGRGVKEVATALHLNVSRVNSILDNTIRSKNVELSDELMVYQKSPAKGPEESLMDAEQIRMLYQCFSELKMQEQIAIALRFGLYLPGWNEDQNEYKFSEIEAIVKDELGDKAFNVSYAFRTGIAALKKKMKKNGEVIKSNKYQNAKDEFSMTLFDKETADEMFEALNDEAID